MLTLTLAALLEAQVPPEKANATFTVSDPELEWSLWASEPLFCNPTTIDIDHLGRVWVCEAVNYRCTLHGRPLNRPEGDRILILEDSKGQGRADKVTVFAQAPYIQAPMGIAVAKDPTGPGWKVYVCQSPDILVFEDKDGDGKADGPPKKLLTGFRGVDHDHGVHGISIGPDGKLYFSVGDQGVKDLQSSDGKGRKWTTNNTDCQAGTIWRCDMDGTNLELIAHNFRNPYKPCVDSFGTIFISDNDDDGSEQTRICYVMPGGNYGYWPRGRGESHWHEEQPGVVPKILRTGFGSPTGMCVYEGALLPKKYWGRVLHTDAGPRQLRAYTMKPQGAGYECLREDIVNSTDTWFRPSDVCVAPDGSVFVADWYDPGVGGHGMGDLTKGRIYRLAPKGSKYMVPKVDLESATGLVTALWSPSLAVRQMAIAKFGALDTVEAARINVPEKLRHSVTGSARMVWESYSIARVSEPSDIGRLIEIKKQDFFDETTILTMRASYASHHVTPADYLATELEKLSGCTSRVRREALLLLREADPNLCKSILFGLFGQHDGRDRFYLAAIGIAVGNDPKRREVILADFDKQFPEWNDKVADLVWELRPAVMMPKLVKMLNERKLTEEQRARIVDILALESAEYGDDLISLFKDESSQRVGEHIISSLVRNLPKRWRELRTSAELETIIEGLHGTAEKNAFGLRLILAAENTKFMTRVCNLSLAGAKEARLDAIRALGSLPYDDILDNLKAVEALKAQLKEQDATLVIAGVRALAERLGRRQPEAFQSQFMEPLTDLLLRRDKPSLEIRRAVVEALASSRFGTNWLLMQVAFLSDDIRADAIRILRNTPYQDLRAKAVAAYPPSAKLDMAKLPEITVLAKKRGDIERGKAILAASANNDAACMKCHTVNGVGGKIGPDLSAIGTKASRENLLESILYPSKAIADQFVQWNVITKKGISLSGLLVEETSEAIVIRDANGQDTKVAKRDIESREKSPKSLMPDDNAKTLTEEELLDLVEYLMTLKKSA